jgi:ethanolaminephosphotransferase
MMTGSIPGFVDVVLNFGSPVLTEDNLIEQLVTHDWRINFFGDDTWIKLFPKHFKIQDGTSSFFVADYSEVRLLFTLDLTPMISLL